MALRPTAPFLAGLAGALALFAPRALLAADQAGAAPPPAARTVILVRHAEKAGDDPRDPSLSAAGAERAEALARLLARARPTRLLASEYRRTQATLAPLARALGLEIETLPAGAPESLVQAVQELAPGAALVVAGHSNTLPELAARLGAPLPDVQETPAGPQLGDGEYDRLFVLHLPPAGAAVSPSVLELRYGR